MLGERHASIGGEIPETLDERGGLHRTVRGMEDRAAEVGARMRKLLTPLGGEAVLAERLVLALDLDPLFDVGRESQTARAPKCVACERLEPLDGVFGAVPELPRGVGAVGLARNVVAGGGAAEGKAAVAAARTLAD